jgi:hypothetical protein
MLADALAGGPQAASLVLERKPLLVMRPACPPNGSSLSSKRHEVLRTVLTQVFEKREAACRRAND